MKPYERLLENPLRIKVTGKCNRQCCFCHKEGGMDNLVDFSYSDSLRDMINDMYDNLKISTIAFTGGEPFLHVGLDKLIYNIMSQTKIKRFSLTTNGTIFAKASYWKFLSDIGLYKVNISIPDIIDVFEMKCQKIDDILSIFKMQKETIQVLNKLDIEVKINIVIFNDHFYTSNIIFNLLKLHKEGLKFDIVLLPDLSNSDTFNRSQSIIEKIINNMQLKKVSQRKRVGTSNLISEYISDYGEKVFIKTTKTLIGNNYYPLLLNSLCGNCGWKKFCQEGFYGIRLEEIKTGYLVRLCLHCNGENQLMSFESFKKSIIYKELQEKWRAYERD